MNITDFWRTLQVHYINFQLKDYTFLTQKTYTILPRLLYIGKVRNEVLRLPCEYPHSSIVMSSLDYFTSSNRRNNGYELHFLSQ